MISSKPLARFKKNIHENQLKEIMGPYKELKSAKPVKAEDIRPCASGWRKS